MTDKPRTLEDLAITVEVMARVDVATALADTMGAPLYKLREALREASRSHEGSDADLSRAFALLGLAFDASLVPSLVPDPFKPLIEWQGSRSVVPADFGAGHLDAIAAALGKHANDPAYDARLADVLWVCAHGGRKDPANARRAIEGYLASARLRLGNEEGSTEVAHTLERALRLSYLVDRRGREGLHEASRNTTLDIARALRTVPEQGHVLLDIHSLLHEFGIGDAAEHGAACEAIASEEERRDAPGAADEFWKQAARWWRRAGEKEREWSAISRRVDLKEKQAEVSAENMPVMAVGLLHEALKILRPLPAKQRAGQEAVLRSRLAELEPHTLAQMGQIRHEMDVTDLVEATEAAIVGKPLVEALGTLAALCRSQDVGRTRKRVEETAKRSVLSSLFSSSVLDANGKTVAFVPSMNADDPEERERAIRFRMIEETNRFQDLSGRAIVETARLVLLAEHRITEAALLPLMWQSPFVPPGREGQWARGIAAGLTGDFEVAVHLLLPQMENALRTAVRAVAGVPATSMDSAGQQKDWNLSTLLVEEGRPLVEKIFGEDLVFDLAALLVERSGYNLRNAVAHGLVGSRLDGGPPRHLLGICLRLVFGIRPPDAVGVPENEDDRLSDEEG